MSQKQEEVEKTVIQPEMHPAIMGWGPSPLWILAGTTVGSLTNDFSITPGGYVPIGTILGGAIGGIFVGFMPSLGKKWRISKVGWWVALFANLTLILVSLFICAYHLHQEAILAQNSVTDVNWQFEFRLTFLLLFITLGLITGVDLAVIIRWVFRRKQRSRTSGWAWLVTGTTLGIITFLGVTLAAVMNAN